MSLKLSGNNTGDQTITLTGDVTGSGTGTFAATLSNTGVSAGSYTNSNITVDSKGRITTISNGSGGSGTVTSVSVVTANGVSGSVATATTTPAITLSLGDITPTSVASVGTITGSNLSGTNTGDQTSISGNAGTATALSPGRNINGVLFDGTSNITVTADASTLTGTVLNSSVVTSSLTSLGVVTSGTWNAGTIGPTRGGTGQTSYTTGDLLYAGSTNTLNKRAIGTNNNVLTVVSGVPTWAPPATSGTVTSVSISSSTVSVSGSPITSSGTITVDLDTTAVTPGSYTNSNLTVDQYGRITSVSNGSSSGTVTSVSVVTANGVSGSVATATTTPAITLTLGAITPTSVAASGTVTGSNLSGTNTGDQTITLTGDVTGTGTGSFATTLATVNSNVGAFNTLTVNAKGLVTAASNTAYIATNDNATLTSLSLPNGALNTPSLKFTNSTSTGLYLSAANVLGISLGSNNGIAISKIGSGAQVRIILQSETTPAGVNANGIAIVGGSPTDTTRSGASVRMLGGTGGTGTGTSGGTAIINGGAGQASGGPVTIAGGNPVGDGTVSTAGGVTIQGGFNPQTTYGVAGAVNILGGQNSNTSDFGGNVIIHGGAGATLAQNGTVTLYSNDNFQVSLTPDGVMNANIALLTLNPNTTVVSNVGTPVALTDAVNKTYADNVSAYKKSANVATTGNITLSGTQTIDGISVPAGYRVLVKDQTTTSENGVYDSSAGAWTRATDFTNALFTVNSLIFVGTGTVNKITSWSNDSVIGTVIGTDPLTFTQVPSGSGSGTVSSVSVVTANGVSGSVATATTTPAITLTLGAITPSSVSTSGNLTFSGTGQRIIGDFSNGTTTNRLYFQTSTTNSTTSVGILPNGTSQNANLALFNSSDPANNSLVTLAAGPSSVNINSTNRGTGSVLPIVFTVGGTIALTIDTAQGLSLNGSNTIDNVPSPTTSLQVANKAYVDSAIVTAGYGPPMTVVSGTSQTATSNNQYIITNTGAVTTVTLPASPANGDVVWVTNCTGRTDCVIANNGNLLMGISASMTIDSINVNVQLRFINSTIGWRIM